MKVYATFNQEVHIEPKDVIQELIEREIGDAYCNWIIEKDGRYLHIREESVGCHPVELEYEISKDKYEYIKALKLVLERLGFVPNR